MKTLVERNNNNDKVLANYVCEYKFKKMYPEIDRMLRVIHFNNNFNRLIQMANILTYLIDGGDINKVEAILELQTPEFKHGFEFGIKMKVI